MAPIHHLLGCGLVVLTLIKCSESMQCYQCSSYSDQRCLKEPLPDEFKQECVAEEEATSHEPFTLCRKIKQTIDFDVNGLKGDTRVIRTCGYDRSNYVDRCFQRSGFGGRQEVCTCESDFCNAAPALAPAALAALLPLLGLRP